jgi:hypothetical protein
MTRTIPLFAGFAMLVLTGVVHGLWTNRWSLSQEPAGSAARLDSVAWTLADWQGVETEPLSAQTLAVGEIDGYLSRIYRNQRTGKTVSVLVVCGRPGPIAAHTPEICFVGTGQEMVSKVRHTVQLGSDPPRLDCYVGEFRRTSSGLVSYSRAIWAWGARGVWTVSDQPRLTYAWEPVLYKMYVMRSLDKANEPLDTDPLMDFLKVFMPELQRNLFAQ